MVLILYYPNICCYICDWETSRAFIDILLPNNNLWISFLSLTKSESGESGESGESSESSESSDSGESSELGVSAEPAVPHESIKNNRRGRCAVSPEVCVKAKCLVFISRGVCRCFP